MHTKAADGMTEFDIFHVFVSKDVNLGSVPSISLEVLVLVHLISPRCTQYNMYYMKKLQVWLLKRKSRATGAFRIVQYYTLGQNQTATSQNPMITIGFPLNL